MKETLLQFLRCAACRQMFQLVVQTAAGPEIEQGSLLCKTCDIHYPIDNGIPRFVTGYEVQKQERTAKRFGDQWQVFPDLGEVWEKQLFDEYILPLTPDAFKDQIVLEAGCGRGRNLMRMSECGARHVIGIDLSVGVDIAYQRTKGLPQVHIIQGDIYALPLFHDFDIVFSAGVLHHLPDPRKGFESIVDHARPNGIVVNTVYGKENNEWIEKFVNPIRLLVTSRMPASVLFFLSKIIAIPLYVVLLLIYKPANEMKALRPIADRLFYNDFLYLMWREGFSGFAAQIYDQLSAPIANYLSRPELERWVKGVGLKNVRFFWRNKNCWNFAGSK